MSCIHTDIGDSKQEMFSLMCASQHFQSPSCGNNGHRRSKSRTNCSFSFCLCTPTELACFSISGAIHLPTSPVLLPSSKVRASSVRGENRTRRIIGRLVMDETTPVCALAPPSLQICQKAVYVRQLISSDQHSFNNKSL